MFRESESTEVVETDHLSDDPTNDDEVTMYVQRGSGDKDTSGNFSSEKPLISLASPKTLSSNMESRSVLPTKTPSFV